MPDTVTFASKLTCIEMVCPDIYEPFPVDEVTPVSLGASVENTIENCVAAVFPFPAASTARLAPKSTVTVPLPDGITSIV